MAAVILSLIPLAITIINIPLMLKIVSIIFDCTIAQLLYRIIAIAYLFCSCYLFSLALEMFVDAVK